MSLRFKLGIVLILMFLMGLVSTVWTFITIEKQKDDAFMISIAGRQAMLSQKIANEAFGIHKNEQVAKYKKMLISSHKMFDQSLKALIYGGKVQMNDEKFIELPPATNSKIKKQMIKVLDIWEKISGAVQEVINSKTHDQKFNKAISTVEEYSLPLLKEMNKAVVMYTDNAYKKITVLKTALLIFLIISLIVFIASFVIVQKFILKPISEVMDIARKIANDDLEHEHISINSSDEIGELARMFNKILDTLKDLAQKAKDIADGKIGAEEVEKRLKDGAKIATATAAGKSGTLNDAFNTMLTKLRVLTVQANLIARDELNHEALDAVQEGELGAAFHLMTQNLRRFAKQAQAIASLDLANEVLEQKVEGDIGEAFQKMTKNLEVFTMQIYNASKQAESVGKEVVGASDGLNRAGQELSEGAQEQSASLEETASSVEEMTSMIGQSANNAAECDKLSLEVLKYVEDGEEKIQSLAETMERINENSIKISETIELIDNIAFQTNLLALNAAVEAANAGEHGAGFAVVADEVRRLAQRVAEAAKEIRGIIQQANRRTEDGVNKSKQSQEAFANITQKMKQVSDRIKDIAVASKEQSNGINEINKAIMELRTVTERNTTNATETAASSEQLKELSDTLGQVVEQLQTLVAQVRLKNKSEQGIKIREKGKQKKVEKSKKKVNIDEEKIIPLEEDKDIF